MSEKHLTELPWKSLVVKHKLKDPGLGRALAELWKCQEGDQENRLKAIKAIEKQAMVLKKENAQDTEVAEYLGEVLKEAEKSRKALGQVKNDGEEKPTDETEGEGEEEDGLSLKDKLVAGMRKAKERQPNDPPVQAILCHAGKAFGVMLGRSVGGTQMSALKEVFKNESGHKFVKGTCTYGAGDIYTFTLDSALSGAAKGLKSFLQEQTGRNYKIRIGDPSGKFEEDAEEGSGDAPKTTPETASVDSQKLIGALNQMLPLVKQAIAGHPGQKEELMQPITAFEKHIKAGEIAQAREALLGLGQVLKQFQGGSPREEEPFQVFVKSFDNVTLTLTLPQRSATTMGVVLNMIEGRTGIPLSELRLNVFGKPVRPDKPELTVADYGVQKESTFMLNGSLKGGFGERAAITQTKLNEIKRGNVRSDVTDTKGVSTAKTSYKRAFAKELRESGANVAGIDISESNRRHLNALVIEALGAGNCGEFRTVVASKISGATTGQWIYECAMDSGHEENLYNHAFVITYPTDEKIGNMDDGQAMVADGWNDNRISTLKQFMNSGNPYGAVLTANNIKVDDHYEALGNAIAPEQAELFKKAVLEKFTEEKDKVQIPVELKSGEKTKWNFEQIRLIAEMSDGPFNFTLEGTVHDERESKELFFSLDEALQKGGAATLLGEFTGMKEELVVEYLGKNWTQFHTQVEKDWDKLSKEQMAELIKKHSEFFEKQSSTIDPNIGPKLPEYISQNIPKKQSNDLSDEFKPGGLEALVEKFAQLQPNQVRDYLSKNWENICSDMEKNWKSPPENYVTEIVDKNIEFFDRLLKRSELTSFSDLQSYVFSKSDD